MTRPTIRDRRRPVSPRPPDRRPPRGGRPAPGEPARLAAAAARWYVEVEAGRRPFAQAAELLSPALRTRIVARLHRQRAAGRATNQPGLRVVRNVRLWQVRDDAYEAVAVVDRGTRTTALAMRLERHHGRWRITELTGPEHGEPPVRSTSRPEPPASRPDAFDEVLAADDRELVDA
jgi:hypothetical protein